LLGRLVHARRLVHPWQGHGNGRQQVAPFFFGWSKVKEAWKKLNDKDQVKEMGAKLAEERKGLKEELKDSLRWGKDVRDLRKTGGKRFEALQMIDLKQAAGFPLVKTTCLDGADMNLPYACSENRATLVVVGMRGAADEMLAAYRQAFEHSKAGRSPQTRIIELWLMERESYKWFKSSFEKGLRKKVPSPARQANTALVTEDVAAIMQGLGVDNPIVGYAFVCDGMGRIRWQAHGEPTDAELATMCSGAEQLLAKPNIKVFKKR